MVKKIKKYKMSRKYR